MKKIPFILVSISAFLMTSVSGAHHSFAKFDRTKRVELKGVVREFNWTNPHIHVRIDVLNAAGIAESWDIEGGSPNYLMVAGWRKTTLQPGDNVTLIINPTRDGSAGGSLVGAIAADGRLIGEGASSDDAKAP